ncbi:dihydroorotate dehydrogenase-like protein [Planctomycetales bacterium ZRK34]|nr:dihydroorotate dehydrogenase-like protein [Planctomycetales bacterium ZRK34]
MIDTKTQYLGFDLPHPFVPGASPMADDLDMVRRLEDAGAPMITLRSLFEEQIVGEQMANFHATAEPAESFAEATSYLPEPEDFAFGPYEYLEHVRKVRDAVDIPVVGSLNGATPGGWLEHAKLIEDAGANALELNIYDVAADPSLDAATVEQRTISMVEQVKARLTIPVAVKLSPFYTSMANFAQQLDETKVDAMVIFNRFYQPDIDVEELEIARMLQLSDSSELRLRLRWLAILSPHVKAKLAVTGGVHTPIDAVKAVMCGASTVQLVSSLLHHGPGFLKAMREQFAQWLESHEYTSLEQMRGSMNMQRSGNPSALERANYMQILQSWQM